MRRPIDPATRLARAIALHARAEDGAFRLGEITTRTWTSPTFEGARIAMELHDVDPDAAWLTGLTAAELRVGGHLVADLLAMPLGVSAVRIEALLLRDA
jgi:hypothetical protein